MAFDYKKEYKEFYLPPEKPGIVDIPEMNFVAVRGKGDPNDPDGEYKAAMNLLYGIAFTIKMSYKGSHQIDGYFSYVVPPLEGLWWQPQSDASLAHIHTDYSLQASVPAQTPHPNAVTNIAYPGIDYSHKETFHWISMIRLPDFVTKEVFDWAVQEATVKKKADFSKTEFFTYKEGLCVQCMHIGSYDEEPATIQKMQEYALVNGFEPDLSTTYPSFEPNISKNDAGSLTLISTGSSPRFHHEIYLSDPRRTAPEKLRTVIRLPCTFA